MTVRDVYDFNVNDEFQYHIIYDPLKPPIGIRIKITGRHASPGNDTLVYVRSHNDYGSVLSYTPTPHLDYTYSVFTDSIYIYNLDTLINAPFRNLPNDSCNIAIGSSYISTEFCGASVFEETVDPSGCFEEHMQNYVFGKGLGQIRYHNIDQTSIPNPTDYSMELFYYKKGSLTCGTEDIRVGIPNYNTIAEDLILYPNPATAVLHVTNIKTHTNIQIHNMLGSLVFETETDTDCSISLLSLANGVYTFSSRNGLGKGSYKIVIANP